MSMLISPMRMRRSIFIFSTCSWMSSLTSFGWRMFFSVSSGMLLSVETTVTEPTPKMRCHNDTETLDTFLPDLIKILSESEGVNPLIRKCVGASPEFSKKIVKGILAAMSPKQKEALTVKFLNVYASKLVAQVNEVAAKNGIVITLDNARATIK